MRPNIIGGKYRGKKIDILNAEGLRPTSSRIRETLFNWLQQDINQVATLDLFAGSGLLSFESLSRGAKQSTLIEKDIKIYQTLKKNAAFLKGAPIIFHNTDALSFIKINSLAPYQLIFIDPPFASTLCHDVLKELTTKLSANTLLYIESPTLIDALPFHSRRIKHKKVGQVFFSLFQTQGRQT